MVTMMSLVELKKLIDISAELKLVNVLDREYFEKEHIPGSISLPVESIAADAEKSLNKSDTIVVYCAGFQCQASTYAAEKLEAMGFFNVFDYKGGMQEYKHAGLPLEGASVQAKA